MDKTAHDLGLDNEIRLSPSIAKILLNESPAHAYAAHSKLGRKPRKETASMNKGKAVDRLVFGTGPALYLSKGKGKDPEELCKAVNWSREAVIITDAVYKEACDVAASALAGMHDRGIVISPDRCQQKWYWSSLGGVKCKGVIDLYDPETGIIYDLKTAHDLSDRAIQFSIEKYGYDVQAGAYLEACTAMGLHRTPRFKWLFVETGHVNDFRVIEPDTRQIGYGTARWLEAVTTWKKCLETDTWPGRPDTVLGPSSFRDKAQAEMFLDQIPETD